MTGMNASSWQCLDHSRIDGSDFPYKTQIDEFTGFFPVRHLQLSGVDEAAVLTGQAYSLTAILIDQHDNILLNLAAKNPFHDFHGFFIGNSHPLNEGAALAYFSECIVDLRSATMNDDGIHADQFEQNNVTAKPCLSFSSVMALPPYLITMVLP